MVIKDIRITKLDPKPEIRALTGIEPGTLRLQVLYNTTSLYQHFNIRFLSKTEPFIVSYKFTAPFSTVDVDVTARWSGKIIDNKYITTRGIL